MNKIHQLEIRKLLKELDYVKSDYEYKNEIVFEADNSFMRTLNDFLDKNFVLKEMFDNKVNGKIDTLIKPSIEEDSEVYLVDKMDKVVDKMKEYEFRIEEILNYNKLDNGQIFQMDILFKNTYV